MIPMRRPALGSRSSDLAFRAKPAKARADATLSGKALCLPNISHMGTLATAFR